ncbi:MAG: hypothetical protein JWN96_2909, partial [Mycobacterium sp.]|nr:hypothetical protein [Mycobacterium sp.]
QPHLSWVADQGSPPELIGKVLVWLLSAPPGTVRNGKTIHATEIGRQLGLLPDDVAAGDATLYR